MRLVAWPPDDLIRRLNDVIGVYGQAMGYPPDLLEARRGYIAAHVRRKGFRAVASLDPNGTLLGFGYGYTSGSGQWWHDQVRCALARPARQTMLPDCLPGARVRRHPNPPGP